jgi:uncharacterized protein (DUF1697 family)
MASVVFLRAANVGGNNVFRPAQVAAKLEHLGVVNIGAAGTFVVREKASRSEIRDELRRHVPFDLAMAIRPGSEIVALSKTEPFKGTTFSKDLRGWVGVLTARHKVRPQFPLLTPGGSTWQVRFERLEGAYAMGLWRRAQDTHFVIPANCIEKAVGVLVTVRWWETLLKIAAVIEKD